MRGHGGGARRDGAREAWEGDGAGGAWEATTREGDDAGGAWEGRRRVTTREDNEV